MTRLYFGDRGKSSLEVKRWNIFEDTGSRDEVLKAEFLFFFVWMKIEQLVLSPPTYMKVFVKM